MALYPRTSDASVGGYEPDDTVLIEIEVLDMLLNDLLKEMGMRRDLFETGKISRRGWWRSIWH